MTDERYIKLDDVSLNYPVYGGQKLKTGSKYADDATSGMGNLVIKGNTPKFVKALQNISLDLRPGDRLALIGRNGSGKTTLLRVMAGIYQPTSGKVSVSGRISTLFAMGMGMRPQSSGYRNIVLLGLFAGYPRSKIEEIVEDVKEFTELGNFLNLPVNSYSQGMAMRLKFAVATAIEPDILIMDEWIGAGDEKFRQKAADRMNAVFHGSGIAVLASHNNKLLQRTCNKAIWLESGKIQAAGDVDEVIELMNAEKKKAIRAELT